MSRSSRRHPVCGVTTARSEKPSKRIWHARFRAAVRQALDRADDLMPAVRELSSPWDFEKDGKQRLDPRRHPEIMRK